MKPYTLQAINGRMYVTAQPGATLEFRELPPEELIVLMLNAETEIYGGNNSLQTLEILTDYDFTA